MKGGGIFDSLELEPELSMTSALQFVISYLFEWHEEGAYYQCLGAAFYRQTP